MKRVVFLTALFTWLCAPSALAHSLHVFAQYDGRTVSGKASYSDMTPAAETYMEILQAGQDSPLLEGKTDHDGQFTYPINTTAEGAIKVVIEGEEGHRASIVANRVSAQTTNNSDNALMLVREDISKLKDKIYLHDIIGGIGYIVGIFGLWALIRASKMTRASQSKER